MADVTINLNEAKKTATDIVSDISALLDILLKGVNAFTDALKEAQKSLSGGMGNGGLIKVVLGAASLGAISGALPCLSGLTISFCRSIKRIAPG